MTALASRQGAVAFSQWAPRYAEHNVATFPVRDKKPAVSGYLRLGVRASQNLASKFADESAFGFALKRNRIAIVDIDTDDRAALDHAVERFGESPLIVRTQSGGHHLYFRNQGERRHVRLVRDPPIDVLGEGFAIAAPSVGEKGQYEFVRGTLEDLRHLPPMRHDSPTVTAGERIQEGERNDALYRHCRDQALHCDNFDALLDVARSFNMDCQPQLPEAEVIRTAKSAWKRTLGGKIRHGLTTIPAPDIEVLAMRDPAALVLLSVLRRHNGPEARFMIANGMAGTHVGMSLYALQRARRTLNNMGIVKQVRPDRRHTPALYAWGDSYAWERI
jgi:hypothetical protein